MAKVKLPAEMEAKLKDLEKRAAQMKKESEALYQEYLQEAMELLFAGNTTLHALSWTQYTPHFNDGDACEFSVHADYPKVTLNDGGDEFEEYDYEGYVEECQSDLFKVEPISEEKFKAICEAVSSVLTRVPEDIMRGAFDEGQVVCRRTKAGKAKFEVEEYDHD